VLKSSDVYKNISNVQTGLDTLLLSSSYGGLKSNIIYKQTNVEIYLCI